MPEVTFGMQLLPVLSTRKLVDTIAQLEVMGFDQVTLADHVLFPERFESADPWAILAAGACRTTRIRLGTGVSDPHRVHPAIMAQRAATLDQLSKGRFTLGLGGGEAMNLDPFGIPWNRPVARLKEAVHVMRHLWDRTEPLDFQGEFYKLSQARLDVRPVQKRLPIHLAALGPVMQKFGGEMMDGWFPVPIPVQFYQEMFAPIEASAKAAGRPGAVRPAAMVPIALTQDEALVRRAARKHVMTMVWGGFAPRMGVEMNLPADVAATHYMTVNPCDPDSMRRYEAHAREIPEDFAMKFIAHGNVNEVRRRLGEYVDAGVRHFNLMNASPDPTGSTIALATDILPYFSGRRAPVVAYIGKLLGPLLPRDTEEKAAVRRMMS